MFGKQSEQFQACHQLKRPGIESIYEFKRKVKTKACLHANVIQLNGPIPAFQIIITKIHQIQLTVLCFIHSLHSGS